ncbi:hypothetical protein McanMca71_006317 [Microsporum canis]|uniref:Uncharacterized protein n=1 Tax=Arthroderma otae (strain ATCC MYA-4605 / CBS 113480) TaxID=554155 RepID=C5FCG6_ARTOC|nr:uncharacterized protein MCYG_00298 [Microsporum canis CBS 113480]EEQ27410.1 predicted protein [Microsporum canis CBS 113480]
MPHSTFFSFHDPDFRHNDENSLKVEFGRLANRRGWTKKNGQYPRRWSQCIEQEFQYHVFCIIDEDGDKLSNMQLICQRYFNETPPSIRACEKILRKVHINLLDWLDARRCGDEPHVFRSYRELKAHTEENKRYFPKFLLDDVPVMKVFLRDFF